MSEGVCGGVGGWTLSVRERDGGVQASKEPIRRQVCKRQLSIDNYQSFSVKRCKNSYPGGDPIDRNWPGTCTMVARPGGSGQGVFFCVLQQFGPFGFFSSTKNERQCMCMWFFSPFVIWKEHTYPFTSSKPRVHWFQYRSQVHLMTHCQVLKMEFGCSLKNKNDPILGRNYATPSFFTFAWLDDPHESLVVSRIDRGGNVSEE